MFSKNKSKKDGLQTTCKCCKKLIDKKYYLANKEKFKQYNRFRKEEIRKFIRKKKTQCETCGETHIATLDFHHIDPTNKKISISNIVQHFWCLEKIQKEIDKCKILCANCHRKLHWNMPV